MDKIRYLYLFKHFFFVFHEVIILLLKLLGAKKSKRFDAETEEQFELRLDRAKERREELERIELTPLHAFYDRFPHTNPKLIQIEKENNCTSISHSQGITNNYLNVESHLVILFINIIN